ncbi:hypothetical protein SO802_027083 [Lithocarpus litseifolius]|uniref:RNase H type-1 domain-containing protein n=1 Tax=Lithocarpus litseifolius TaxID=425828 RepID=A0AAW2C331_9ROSI
MNRFVQELEDREQSEAEMRKLKEDLNSKSSPLSSSSSSKALVDSECFRLYFKVVVSEERVRGIMVNVAGARVAICDPQGNLILEARKNVEAMVNGVVVSGEVAELQALIEALSKALALDLKSVTFFGDDYNCFSELHFGMALNFSCNSTSFPQHQVRVNLKSSKNLDNVENLDKTIGIPSLSSYAVQASSVNDDEDLHRKAGIQASLLWFKL